MSNHYFYNLFCLFLPSPVLLQGDVLMALLQRIAGARNKAADEAAAAAAAKGGIGGVQHVQPQRLKVILMSATLDANIYR
jgi:HrpA-like RNA helicase